MTPDNTPTGDTRPSQCRFRLQDEGKPYPRSACTACGKTITTGLGKRCAVPAVPTPQVVQGLINRVRRQVEHNGWEEPYISKIVGEYFPTPVNTPTPQAGEKLVERLQIMSGMLTMGERIAFGSDASLMDEAATAILTLQSELEEAQREATYLCNVLAEKHYPDRSPEWKPLPDIVGILTQINNMTAGLSRAEKAEADLKGMTDLAIEHEDRAESAESEVVKLRAALGRSQLALSDWLHLYASDQCNEDKVAEAKARVGEHGTLAYIAFVQEQNRAALGERDKELKLYRAASDGLMEERKR